MQPHEYSRLGPDPPHAGCAARHQRRPDPMSRVVEAQECRGHGRDDGDSNNRVGDGLGAKELRYHWAGKHDVVARVDQISETLALDTASAARTQGDRQEADGQELEDPRQARSRWTQGRSPGAIC